MKIKSRALCANENEKEKKKQETRVKLIFNDLGVENLYMGILIHVYITYTRRKRRHRIFIGLILTSLLFFAHPSSCTDTDRRDYMGYGNFGQTKLILHQRYVRR